MSTYAIGDVQGCFRELEDLLAAFAYRPGEDRLWFAGDLVNRGPQSLEVLRFVADLGDRASVVLGNHDLNLLAVASGVRKARPSDTLDAVLGAADGAALVDWLADRPMLLRDAELDCVLVHAGLAPQWSVDDAQALAAELEAALSLAGRRDFLANMYGNQPALWDPALAGWERLRFITNALTRIRYVDARGAIDLDEDGPPGRQAAGLVPWFASPDRRSRGERILFGHWAALELSEAECREHRVHHLDTGCVWGGRLTAMRVEDERYFSVPSRQPRQR
ncbi:MAG: symmetrical bis(5'-nucleosyl)-tetraphosphatase [Gammaproteobacteria bacterium]|nr:symmetrical bis(5'-nucleosyl)-tetraphosphatase [Gammaproteobacteria bacterium]